MQLYDSFLKSDLRTKVKMVRERLVYKMRLFLRSLAIAKCREKAEIL